MNLGSEKNKPKIMMHHVKPGATGGPNKLYERIENAELLKEKYDFVRLNQFKVAGGKINFKLIKEMKKIIQSEKPDIIHISGMQSTGFHCMLAAVLAGKTKKIITTHGFSGEAIGTPFYKRLIFNYIIEPLTLILADKVHAISMFTENKKMVRKYAKHKTTRIYNFPPSEAELANFQNIRGSLGISSDDKVFTIVSRIVIDKGYKNLAEALLSLNNIPGLKFIIVGDGEYEEVFKELIKNEIENKRVFMLGKRTDVMNILHESDVFILPTLHENLGNVFLEASKAGVPSIGTDVGGVPEIVINGVTGILIPPNDSKALENAIMSLYKNEKLIKEMGENAKKRLNSFFDKETIEKEFVKLYDSLL